MAKRSKTTVRSPKTRAKSTKQSKTSVNKQRKPSFIFPIRADDTDSSQDGQMFADDNIFGPKTLRSPQQNSFNGRAGFIGLEPPNSSGGRRFSDLYGHGHFLDKVSDFPSPAQGKKRRGTYTSEEISPKKVRFASPVHSNEASDPGYLDVVDDCYDSEATRHIDLSLGQELRASAEITSHSDLELLMKLSTTISPVPITQISSLLRLLQKLTGDFAAGYFAQALDDNVQAVALDMETFPLEDLQLKHPALYLTVVNVLDASTTDITNELPSIQNTGWLKFFAHPNYRPYLVSAILGEWFCQRIFKDNAFGLAPAARKQIEESIDKQYIHFDSFVRAKIRSLVVEFHREEPDADFWLQKASRDLADELMVVLAPFMPFFKMSDPYNEHLTPADTDHKLVIYSSLVELIRHCAVTNLTIVKSGENGTVVRPANRLEHGKPFNSSAPMECVNPEMCDILRDDSLTGEHEKLVVKMSCWPRMEAWVPHGMDREQMGQLERTLRFSQLPSPIQAKLKRNQELTPIDLQSLGKEFCWDCSIARHKWDVLPTSLWHKDKERRNRQAMIQKSYDQRRRIETAQLKKRKGDNIDPSSGDSDVSTPSASDLTDDEDMDTEATQDTEDEFPRGSWITEYTCLAPHMVYCEWTKSQDYYTTLLTGTDQTNAGKTIKQINSLENAVKQAREDLIFPSSLVAKKDDLLLKLWNFYASHNLVIEWGTFLVAVLIVLSREGMLDNVSNIIKPPYKATAYVVDETLDMIGIKALYRGIIDVTKNLAHGVHSTSISAEIHREHVHLPEHVLNDATSYVDQNWTIFRTAIWNAWPFGKTNTLDRITQSVPSDLLEAVGSMKTFVGQRKPFTSNPISQLKSIGSIASKSAAATVTAAAYGTIAAESSSATQSLLDWLVGTKSTAQPRVLGPQTVTNIVSATPTPVKDSSRSNIVHDSIDTPHWGLKKYFGFGPPVSRVIKVSPGGATVHNRGQRVTLGKKYTVNLITPEPSQAPPGSFKEVKNNVMGQVRRGKTKTISALKPGQTTTLTSD